MARKQIQARVPDDMAEQIEEYQEDGEFMNETEVIRSLLRAGLEAGQEDSGGADSFLERLARNVVFIPAVLFGIIGMLLPYPGILAYQAGDPLLASLYIALSFVLMIGGAVFALGSALAQIALARPLRGLVGFGSGVTADE